LTKAAATNIGLAIWRLKCFYETFVQGSTLVTLLNFCAKNPPHCQAENRSTPLKHKNEAIIDDIIHTEHLQLIRL
jgi:hypothetical protein